MRISKVPNKARMARVSREQGPATQPGSISIRRASTRRSGSRFAKSNSQRKIRVFCWELLFANLDQLRLVLSRRIEIEPGWVEVPCSLETLAMRALFGTLLTLTPGSLTYEETTDENGRWTLHMHLLDTRQGEAALGRVRQRFEAPLRRMENL